MPGGKLGEIFAALSFAGALVAMISFFLASRREGGDKKAWERIATISWFGHLTGILGVVAVLFYLISNHQYQYYYVWDHSSNEMPSQYIISCFWEGQEGSFLLWTFWHGILGSIIYFTAKSWRNIVLSIIASVNVILASMILGINVPEWASMLLFALAILIPAGYFLQRWMQNRTTGDSKGYVQFAGLSLAIVTIGLIVSGNTGFFSLDKLDELLTFSNLPFLLYYLAWVGFFGLFYHYLVTTLSKPGVKKLSMGEFFSGNLILILAFVAMVFPMASWKIGSTPFILLKDVFPEAQIFVDNPDFVPPNGSGLNTLLQNYWMVIHPPTLFLGFAATVVPFAYVIGGLITGRYTEWIRPAAPWTIFSVMVLGVGIIMGGYWAYETLNFGGYWNWDPVENSSFVPWLIGIASLHAMLAFRKTKLFLKFTMIMVVLTFLLVLYSTFLTRSGILGETSVHSFTDLGLSGQLLILLFAFLFGVIYIFMSRWKDMPIKVASIPLASAEFFLFLGTLTFLFAGLVVTVFTSIPVLNTMFDTSMAPPSEGPFFYYRWTVYFAVCFGLLSAMGSFLFWRKRGNKRVRDALFRPFLIASVVAAGIIAVMAFSDFQFGFDSNYNEWVELAGLKEGIIAKSWIYIKWFFFVFADELLLFSSIFTIVANLDILIFLIRKNKKSWRVTGGSLAHVGFGLMLAGIIFSSGYDSVISRNINPGEVSFMPFADRQDHVLLLKGRERYINGFQVKYLGTVQAKAPISKLTVIQVDKESFKVKFDDSQGYEFSFILPKAVFLSPDGEIDMPTVEEFLNDKVEFIKPEHINGRTIHNVQFTPWTRDEQGRILLHKGDSFVLKPEDERQENMGAVSHPSRKITVGRDIYVNVYTIPEEEEEAKYKYYNFEMAMGDTMQTARGQIYFDKLGSEPIEGTKYDLIAKAELRILTDQGSIVEATPLYRIDSENRVSIKDHFVEEIHTSIAFVGIDTNNGHIFLQVQERENPPRELIVMKANVKPMINVLWLGTFILVFGFILAIVRRVQENRKARPSKAA